MSTEPAEIISHTKVDAIASKAKEKLRSNYQAVDGLRAISMCLIIIYHCFLVSHILIGEQQFNRIIREMPLFFRWIWHADKSVDIFFVISGFLISSMLFKEHRSSGIIDLKSFYWRRFLRLIPMYWLALLCFYPFLANNQNIWANLLYINNFLPADKMFMGWSWSLAVEEQFYILFPLFILLSFKYFRSMFRVLIGLIILSALIRLGFHYGYSEFSHMHPSQFMFGNIEGFTMRYFSIIYDNLYTRFGALACGCLIGFMHVFHSQKVIAYFEANPLMVKCLLYGSVLVIVLQTAIPHYNPDVAFGPSFMTWYSSLHRHVFSIAISVLLLLSLYPVTWNNFVSKFLSLPFWGFIAKLTYSMYLFHLALVLGVASELHKYFGDLSGASLAYVLSVIWLNVFIVLALSIGIACITYFGFEKPVMNMRRPAKFSA